MCFSIVGYFGFFKVLAPLPIGFAVFMVHLATIPITGTGINPARSLGAAVIFNNEKAWDDQVSIFHSIPSRRLPIYYHCQSNLIFIPFLFAVDLLGWTLHRCSHCSFLPPVHIESWSCQGSWIIQEHSSCLIWRPVCFLLPPFLGVKKRKSIWKEENVSDGDWNNNYGSLFYLCVLWMRAWNCRYHLYGNGKLFVSLPLKALLF